MASMIERLKALPIWIYLQVMGTLQHLGTTAEALIKNHGKRYAYLGSATVVCMCLGGLTDFDLIRAYVARFATIGFGVVYGLVMVDLIDHCLFPAYDTEQELKNGNLAVALFNSLLLVTILVCVVFGF